MREKKQKRTPTVQPNKRKSAHTQTPVYFHSNVTEKIPKRETNRKLEKSGKVPSRKMVRFRIKTIIWKADSVTLLWINLLHTPPASVSLLASRNNNSQLWEKMIYQKPSLVHQKQKNVMLACMWCCSNRNKHKMAIHVFKQVLQKVHFRRTNAAVFSVSFVFVSLSYYTKLYIIILLAS